MNITVKEKYHCLLSSHDRKTAPLKIKNNTFFFFFAMGPWTLPQPVQEIWCTQHLCNNQKDTHTQGHPHIYGQEVKESEEVKEK